MRNEGTRPATAKVVVAARIENLQDVYEAEKGVLPADRVRTVEVPDALVDTNATMLSLPRRLVVQLGLEHQRSRRARASAGIVPLDIYGAVRLTVLGRECIMEVAEAPGDCPALIGRMPLAVLDFVVDPMGQRLIGNPDHGGEQMIDMF
jgi:predicted aspartyl protease